MPKFRVVSGTLHTVIEDESRLKVLERIADWNGISVEEVREDNKKKTKRREE